MIYRWPKVSDLYGSFGQRKGLDSKSYFIRQSVRYFLRCFFVREEINQFVMFVNQNSRLINFFSCYRGSDYRILCVGFANRLFSSKQRLELIEYNLSYIQELTFFDRFVAGEKEILYESNWGLKIVFRVNGTFEEGFFAIELRLNEERIYGLSFCFLKEVDSIKLLIPSLQGLAQGDEAKEKIKVITKKSFGLRPQNLLIEVARLIAKYKRCEAVLGISQVAQVRYSPFGKRGYFIDYDALWQECGGKKQDEYYFDITEEKRKDLMEISSQKRSMYKKRFALIDDIKQGVEFKLNNLRF